MFTLLYLYCCYAFDIIYVIVIKEDLRIACTATWHYMKTKAPWIVLHFLLCLKESFSFMVIWKISFENLFIAKMSFWFSLLVQPTKRSRSDKDSKTAKDRVWRGFKGVFLPRAEDFWRLSGVTITNSDLIYLSHC